MEAPRTYDFKNLHYRGEGGVLIPALQRVQTEDGFISRERIAEIHRKTGIPLSHIFGVATFYAQFRLQPVGRNKVTLCTNLPCQLQGADKIAEHLQARLGIGFGETTQDGRYTLKEGECMGACGHGPLCLHNNHKMHDHLTPESVDKLLDEMK